MNIVESLHNFKIVVSPWALLGVVVLAIFLSTMGDFAVYGFTPFVATLLNKALPAILTAMAAVFVTPSGSTKTIALTPDPKNTSSYVPPTIAA